MPEIGGVNLPFLPIGGINELRKGTNTTAGSKAGDFDNIFEQELEKVKFSGHAETRMKSRNINISDVEMLRLDEALNKAEAKNARESLVFMDDKAFIVSVPNRTVITMFTKEQMNENVITNIDSAIIA